VTEFTNPDTEDDKTVRETVAGNVRAFRQLRGMDQADLARRMYSLSLQWSRVTVSEVERGERNVTVAELLKLALALRTTIEQLLDTRGPERIRGPRLALYDRPEDPAERTPFHVALPATAVTALVCTHPSGPQLVAEWDDHWLSHLHIVDESAS
jgi:transcriptional regulator with XRE-family HTH domain